MHRNPIEYSSLDNLLRDIHNVLIDVILNVTAHKTGEGKAQLYYSFSLFV